ncbi:hypothetical protein EFL04_09710 [Enterococcus faecium]|nr:hypothetical protein [Enterococcus faecium]
MWKAISTKFFLILETKQLFHNLSTKRCSKASFSVLSQIYAKMWKAISTKFFLILETKQLFHHLLWINSVQQTWEWNSFTHMVDTSNPSDCSFKT